MLKIVLLCNSWHTFVICKNVVLTASINQGAGVQCAYVYQQHAGYYGNDNYA